MATYRSANANPARIPALGIRLLVCVALSIVLMFIDHRQHHLDTLRKAIGAAVYPAQIMVDAPFRLWNWLTESVADRNALQLQVGRLEAERLLTRAELLQLTALRAENDRLRKLLDARPRSRDEIRVAEIMSVDANPYQHNIVIGIGSHDGVYEGQAIVDANGVIGQVLEVGLTTSQAILISDPSHALPVEVSRNGLRTIANGTGAFDRLDLPFLPNNADVRAGDVLVTSGLGGAFPAGYPVAVIDTVNRIPQAPFADVTAMPSSALDQVREVLLIWAGDSADDADE
ncbi:MAG: rod shape-determining protein MreC [Proteobacteria bacterium]|nr:rod shape-determining protein MreC [Pseudomonadota bacterium]MDA1063545.1 rod shape-determining protein MreC [Pseudomonadota bacterium]